MNVYFILISFVSLFLLELLYFKIADRYNIIDKPNHRSSHSSVTIRGGGIIFPIAILTGSIYLGFEYKCFTAGLVIISIVSFADDVKPVSSLLRISTHLIAVSLLFYQLGMFAITIPIILLGLFFVIGSINAINFMDGINGITGSYGLVALLTLLYLNRYVVAFTTENYLILPILALLVFNFFNFRKKAKCFAGDVGSVSIAFIILFFLFQLIIKTNNIGYILLLLMYGLDTAITLMLRYYRKEKLSEAHRSHFYQFLANEYGMPHLAVAALYAILQIVINVLLIAVLPNSILNSALILAVGIVVYISVRLIMEGPKVLFEKHKTP